MIAAPTSYRWLAIGLILIAVFAASFAASTAMAQTGSPAASTKASERNLSSVVEPLWVDLTPAQQEVLKAFEPQWNTWPSNEKKVWVVLANRFPGFSPKAKARALERVREWAALTPAQRGIARQNYQLAHQRGKAEREAEWRQYQQMTPEQQKVLRSNGTISNTAARGAPPSGLARDAAKPLSIFPVINPRNDR